ncbi:hypothetical protein KFL_006770190, partial [Klebsormidium nitens]
MFCIAGIFSIYLALTK